MQTTQQLLERIKAKETSLIPLYEGWVTYTAEEHQAVPSLLSHINSKAAHTAQQLIEELQINNLPHMADGSFNITAKQRDAIELQLSKEQGMRWVKCSERLPTEIRMYVTKIRIIDDGLTFLPVAYNQYDTIQNKWTNPSCCGTSGEVIEWLDESADRSQQHP